MDKHRLETFTDGVLAIIITIMVLELKVPHGEDLSALLPLWPVALSYLLSFLYVGIYWNNHHHMFKAATHINGTILWWNLHLLFWLSLLPFTTGWMGENHFARLPVLLYGLNLWACAIAYFILQSSLVRFLGRDSLLARAIGHDIKGKISPTLYVFGIGAIWFDFSFAGMVFFTGVALLWLAPDRRVEKLLTAEK